MFSKQYLPFYLALLFGIVPSSLFAATDLPGCTSKKCHSSMENAANQHPSKYKCSHCHKADNNGHPDKETLDFTTIKSPCSGCHPEITDHKYLHPPVAAGDCLSCHLVHGTKRNNYLNEQDNIICYNCHNDVVEDGELVMHGEISKNKCSSCHTVHGSSYRGLLRGSYSLLFFNDYSEEAYQFCFRCHKEDLLLHPRTSYNTKFRDAKKNLHYLHVNKKNKGHSCSSCHRTHASTLSHLMATTVTFGKWQLPINFRPTDKGGKCSPGCHEARSYSRSLVRK